MPDQENKKFAAFVMTYQRPKILISTLESLLAQSLPPAHILVVDNSDDLQTKTALENFSHSGVEYYRVGKNLGPAGAAKIGLQELTKRGYEWIYWGDDDNPPNYSNEFESLLESIPDLLKDYPKLGVLGGKGGKLNIYTGRIRALTNEELISDRFVKVDSIPGGHTLLVNSAVVRKGILPSEQLFFGFEELDFCLKAKKKGFEILIYAERWLKVRTDAGNTGKNYRPRATSFGNPDLLWREYYSTRNLLFIFYSNGFYIAFAYWFIKSIAKSFVGFFCGIAYGRKNFSQQWKALVDFTKI